MARTYNGTSQDHGDDLRFEGSLSPASLSAVVVPAHAPVAAELSEGKAQRNTTISSESYQCRSGVLLSSPGSPRKHRDQIFLHEIPMLVRHLDASLLSLPAFRFRIGFP